MTWCVDHPDPDVSESNIRWVEQHILLVQPAGDFHKFFRALPYTEPYALGWLREFADAMEEDYHGSKGNPTATLAESAEFIKAGPAETELASKYLVNTSIDLSTLAGDGFQIAELANVYENRAGMYELSPPGRHMHYLPRFQLFLDRVNRNADKRA